MTRFKKQVSRDRFGRTRKYAPDFARYEDEKKRFVRENPNATPDEYQQFIANLALRCGI